mmetsp:Transcript_13116/g.48996  ORF Transcript_13116/g.48996 Transcript_13116/m.48996 type:complete len:559 (+) Transcript_13116:2525-4201(+)
MSCPRRWRCLTRGSFPWSARLSCEAPRNPAFPRTKAKTSRERRTANARWTRETRRVAVKSRGWSPANRKTRVMKKKRVTQVTRNPMLKNSHPRRMKNQNRRFVMSQEFQKAFDTSSGRATRFPFRSSPWYSSSVDRSSFLSFGPLYPPATFCFFPPFCAAFVKSRHPPTRPSRAFSLSHSFAALLFRLRSANSSASSFSTRVSSDLIRSVSLRRRHSMSTMIFRASSFHSSWNSSLARNAASCASRFPENRTRSTTSFRVFLRHSFVTVSFARSKLKSSSFFTSGVPSNCCACPIASNAAFAFACWHLSGCTNSDTLRNARFTSFSSASNFRPRCSYGFNLKQPKIRSTSASLVASETSAKNSRSSVSESFSSSMGGGGCEAAAPAAATMDSRATAAFAAASSSKSDLGSGFVSGSAGFVSSDPPIAVRFARRKYVSSFVSLTTTWYRSRSATYATTTPFKPFRSGRAFSPEIETSVLGISVAVPETPGVGTVAGAGAALFAAAAPPDVDPTSVTFKFTAFKYSSSPPSTVIWYRSRSDAKVTTRARLPFRSGRALRP